MLRHSGLVLPVPMGLVRMGPLVAVSLSRHHGAQFADDVEPVDVKMLIDTGAQRTAIEKSISTKLGLFPIRYNQMIGFSQIPETFPVFFLDVSIALSEGQRTYTATYPMECVGTADSPQNDGISGILGRDFLLHMKLSYDGMKGTFELVPCSRTVADEDGIAATIKRADNIRLKRKNVKKRRGW